MIHHRTLPILHPKTQLQAVQTGRLELPKVPGAQLCFADGLLPLRRLQGPRRLTTLFYLLKFDANIFENDDIARRYSEGLFAED